MHHSPFTLDTLVELQDQYSDVYPLSPTGARGWVRARREMPKTDPEVYIEWDAHHWRYHGEKDGWTWEHHFRAVEDQVPDAPALPDMNEILANAHRQVEAERCQCGGSHDAQAEFVDTLIEAQEAALGSDGYFVITLTPREKDGLAICEPEIFACSVSPAAKKMIEAQLVSIATELLNAHLSQQVADLQGRPPDEPRR